MDRRNFLGASATAAAVTGAAGAGFASDGRLFGEPQSVIPAGEIGAAPHLLKLHLEVERVPRDQFSKWLAFAQIADNIISVPGAAASFKADPDGYLSRAGFPDIVFDVDSYQGRVVEALANPILQKAARHGDTLAFLEAFEMLGLSPPWICGNSVYTHTDCYTEVAIAVGAIVAVFVYAFAIVDGIRSHEPHAAAQIAAVTGGKGFAIDVIKAMAQRKADDLIQAIETGKVQIFAGYEKDAVIASIKQTVARHYP